MKNRQDTRSLLLDVLYKKAKGYNYKEKTDEYNVAEGVRVLVKSKVVTKRMHPDVNAVKALLQLQQDGASLEQMTDQQLMEEKQRLLQLLAECESPLQGQDE